MTVLMFSPRFVPLVESGAKTQTIRGPRKRPVKPGDSLSLRAWTGKAYRSPQRELAVGLCASVEPIRVDADRHGLAAEVAGVRLGKVAVARLALADGFEGVGDMRRHYETVRALPFEGVLIRWGGGPVLNQSTLFGPDARKGATLSPCGLYRYTLTREWGDCPACDGTGEVCCNCDDRGCSECVDGVRTCQGCDGSGYMDPHDDRGWED